MAALEIFSSSVNYKYKSKLCSLSFFAVIFFMILSLLTPFFIINNAGGFFLRNRVYTEVPDTAFNYKYIVLANRHQDMNPIVCTTFETYKNNKITDDCTLIKVQELDTNNDGRKDILKFEAHFYTDKPIKSLKFVLFFTFTLRQLFQATIESIAIFDYTLNEEIQSIEFSGDLMLQQRGLLSNDGLYETHNHSIELGDYTLEELFMQNANRKFSAKVSDEHVAVRIGFANEDAVIIYGVIKYREYLIYYQPNVWEELKWAWIQYLSCLLVFAYLAKHILIFLFSNRYLSCYTIVPWNNK